VPRTCAACGRKMRHIVAPCFRARTFFLRPNLSSRNMRRTGIYSCASGVRFSGQSNSNYVNTFK
jgi:hypothetical protein